MVRISSNMSMMLLEAGLSVPKPTRTPCVQHVGQRRDAAAQLGVALGAVRHGGALAVRMRMSSRVSVHAVDGQEVLVEHVPLLQVLDGADAVRLDEHALPAHLLAVVVGELARAGADVGELLAALGHVAHDLEAALPGQPRDGLVQRGSRPCTARAGRARRRCAAGAAACAAASRRSHVGHRLVEARVVDAEDLEVEAAAQAGLGGRLERDRRRSWCRRWW